MSELFKIILTSAITVVGGMFVFVIGQVLVKFVIEPLHEQSKLIGEIGNSLVLYSNVDTGMESYYFQQLKNAGQMDEPARSLAIKRYEQIIQNYWQRSDDAAAVLRGQASLLMGHTHVIPQYWFWARVLRKPRLNDVLEASTQLVGMSNSTHQETSHDARIREIAKRLRIRVLCKRYGIK